VRFLEKCTRCAECIQVCPTGLLMAGQGGFPEANFKPGQAVDGCTFCGECLKVCQQAALQQHPEQAPWAYRITIGDSCLTRQGVVCRTCGESCELGAIRFKPQLGGVSLPQLLLEACSGCAACLADCPTQAIHMNFFAEQGAA
jgi:ferredoxin-type protein NapF